MSFNRLGYDRWSTFYDGFANSTVWSDDQSFPALWQHLRGVKVLEIGCGTGRHTRRLVAQGNDVVGLDLSAGMLRQARGKPELRDVEFVEADFLAWSGLACRANTFDAVVAALVLEHFKELHPVFERVALALKPGGAAFFSELHPGRARGGALAHFPSADGSGEIYLQSFIHAPATLEAHADAAGLELVGFTEFVADGCIARANPDWQRHVGRTMLQLRTFRKRGDA